MILTIGMAAYDDYEGVWSTLVALRDQAIAAEVADQIEFLVVNNFAKDPLTDELRKLVDSMGGRYIEHFNEVGTAPPRNRVFTEATGQWVLCVDSHVHLPTGVLARLVAWCDQNRDTLDLYQGVLLRSFLADRDGKPAISWTHWTSRMGEDGLMGKAATNPAAADPECPPFPIPGGGAGLLLSRKAAWLGFHPGFRNFGVEGYLGPKYYKAGRTVWCLPWLRWVHRFRSKKDKAPYPTSWVSRTRNYVLASLELGTPTLAEIRRSHVEHAGRTTLKEWQAILKELGVDDIEQAPAPAPKVASVPAPLMISTDVAKLEAGYLETMPCRHRGRRSGTVLCNVGCPSMQSKSYSTYDCRKHGLVVLSSIRKDLKICATCEDFEAR